MSDLSQRARSLAESWKAKAIESREESGRIRRTIHAATDAEERCLVRAEVWDKCADELLSLANILEVGLQEVLKEKDAETDALIQSRDEDVRSWMAGFDRWKARAEHAEAALTVAQTEIAALKSALREKDAEIEKLRNEIKIQGLVDLRLRRSWDEAIERREQAEAALTSAQAEIAELKKERTELHAHCDENGI